MHIYEHAHSFLLPALTIISRGQESKNKKKMGCCIKIRKILSSKVSCFKIFTNKRKFFSAIKSLPYIRELLYICENIWFIQKNILLWSISTPKRIWNDTRFLWNNFLVMVFCEQQNCWELAMNTFFKKKKLKKYKYSSLVFYEKNASHRKKTYKCMSLYVSFASWNSINWKPHKFEEEKVLKNCIR